MENDCELLPIMLNRKTDRKRNSFIRSPTYKLYMCNMANMKRITLKASEEKSFENVDDGRTNGRTDDGRTTDTSINYKLTYDPSAQVS